MAVNDQRAKVYLDQNVLDFLIKGKLNWVAEQLKSTIDGGYQVVYSPATVSEIARIDNEQYRGRFFKCLAELDAMYFWVDQDSCAHFEKKDPEKVCLENQLNTIDYFEVENAIEQLLYKFMGGRKGENFAVVLSDQREATGKLIDQLIRESSKDASVIDQLKRMKEKFAEDIWLMTTLLDENDEWDSKQYDVIKFMRDHAGIGPDKLNNIAPPDVIQKIGKVLTQFELIPEGMKPEILFGKERIQDRMDMTASGVVEEVNGLYNLLNTIGYHADAKLSRERNFFAAISDHHHAGYGAFAEIILTRDRRFFKKAQAVYEYLHIGTRVILLDGK